MKKSLLALAVLGAFAGAASAQSSVTLYGTVDVNGRYIKNDGSSRRLSMSQDGINSSQLGFRGIEDLGGGLKAGFTLLAGVNPDTGSSNAKFWNRRSTISLFSNMGELRLGRDYTPTFLVDTAFDAFGTNGLGDSSKVLQLPTNTYVRADNAISYFLPSTLGGIYGQAMVASADGATPVPGLAATAAAPANGSPTGSPLNGTANQGRFLSARLGFAAGPFDVAVGFNQLRYAFASGSNLPGGYQHTYNIGGSYDFGFFKLLGHFDYDRIRLQNEKRGEISAVFPFGQSEVRIGYDRSRLRNDSAALPAGRYSNTAWNAKATYQYNLSKRTAMYGTIANLNNGDRSAIGLGSTGTSQKAAPILGGDSKGFELGRSSSLLIQRPRERVVGSDSKGRPRAAFSLARVTGIPV